MTRFARASSYINAGLIAARSGGDSFRVSKAGSPNYGKMYSDLNTQKTQDQKSQLERDSLTNTSRMRLARDAKMDELKDSIDATVAEGKRNVRKAGLLGAAGVMAGQALTPKPNIDKPEGSGESRTLIQDLLNREEAQRTDLQRRQEELYQSSTSGTKSTTKVGEETGATTADGQSRSMISTPTGEVYSQKDMENLLIKVGMRPEDARIGAAIGMAESRGKTNARSHPDLEARTKERSLGLWQHNMNTGEDRLKLYGLSNETELFDPLKNAKATKILFDRAGGWYDWGAYDNKSYLDFLTP